MNTFSSVLFVGAGGFVGSTLRYLLSLFGTRYSITFPHGTLWANLLGCLALGALSGITMHSHAISPNTRLFLATGLCGGFTTMSTFTHEVVHFTRAGQSPFAALYVAGTLIGCIAFFVAGSFLAERWMKG